MYQHPLRHNEFWTVEEETQLKELMRQEMTIREVAETMERTPMAVLLRVRRIVGIDMPIMETAGVTYKDNTRWMEHEDSYLMEQFLAGQSVNSLAKYFDRTPKAVVARLNKVLTDASELNKTYQRIRKLRKLYPSPSLKK
ncbi:MAG: hypothetical protein MJZ79_06505 [Paludibacteraceae bacterium]|nr:hypothetical protein [Paludibacteraceae bacterium]